jgi:PAS domain S-box-containing protein
MDLALNRGEADDRWLGMLGYRPGDFPDFNLDLWQRLTHAEDRSNFERALGAMQADGELLGSFEARLQHRDQGYLWFLHRFKILARDPTGRPVHVVGATFDNTERKRVIDAFNRTCDLLEQTNRVARVGGWELQLEPLSLFWSETARDIHEVPAGYEPELNRAIAFYKEGYSRERIAEAVTQAMNEGTPYDLELPIITARGNELWVRAIGKAEFVDGRCRRLFGTFQDIDAQHRSRDKISEQSEFLDRIVMSLPEGFALFENNGRILRVNPAFCAMTGYSATELTGQVPPYSFGPVDSAETPVEIAWQSSPLWVFPDSMELVFQRKNGETFMALVNPATIRDANGAPLYSFATIHDVSERKRAEAALFESQQLYAGLVASAPVGVFKTDAAGQCLFANATCCAIVGLDSAEILAQGWLSALPSVDRVAVQAEWRRALATKSAFSRECRIAPAEGADRWVLVQTVPLLDPAGILVGYIGTLTEITERKRIEDALREADRQRTEFLALLAHELRNPLNPIRHAVKLMQQTADHSEQEWCREVIDRQVNHLARLIDDLLDISRIARNRLELRREPVQLQSVVETALSMTQGLVDQRRQSVTVSLPPQPVWLDGDPVRLSQIFMNLISNAAKYTTEGGRIEIRTVLAGEQVAVSIVDNGAGIPREHLPHLFDMFFQVPETRRLALGGLGIGLCLTRQLVELHGGTIHAHSDGPGEGSEFVVRLPVEKRLELAPRTPESRATGAIASRHRVLIVDDHPFAADSLARLMRAQGQDARTARDGHSALVLVDEFRPDWILLDIGLPGMDGHEVCRRVRRLPGGDAIRIVAVTGWGREEDRVQSREAGFDHHLVKPLDFAELASLMDPCPAEPA